MYTYTYIYTRMHIHIYTHIHIVYIVPTCGVHDIACLCTHVLMQYDTVVTLLCTARQRVVM